jgi:uncharacterized protein
LTAGHPLRATHQHWEQQSGLQLNVVSFMQKHTSSLLECRAECEEESSCLSLDYNEGICRLNNQRTDDTHQLRKANGTHMFWHCDSS